MKCFNEGQRHMLDEQVLQWWWVSMACGLAAGLSVAVRVSLIAFRRVHWLLVWEYGLMGVVLGAVAGYCMSWLSLATPNWPMRILTASLVGGLVAVLSTPGFTGEGRYLLPIGAVSAAVSAALVWSMSEP